MPGQVWSADLATDEITVCASALDFRRLSGYGDQIRPVLSVESDFRLPEPQGPGEGISQGGAEEGGGTRASKVRESIGILSMTLRGRA
jgi:hypothetical protein